MPTEPISIREIDHVVLRVSDLARMQRFYHEVLGDVEAGPVESRFGAEGEGPSIYLHDPEGNMIELKGPAAP
jgi:catechol 2,3-dioxygenase-like lactoylglutathione lyase family enzyme